MQQITLKIAVILTILLHAPFAIEQLEAIAHDVTPSSKPFDTIVLSTLFAGQAKRLLASIEVLDPPQQDTKDIKVKSAAL